MFCLQSYQGPIIDRSLVYLSYSQDMINKQVIYQFALDQVECSSYFHFVIVNKILRHRHSWSAGQ